jgi:hypothetical protein
MKRYRERLQEVTPPEDLRNGYGVTRNDTQVTPTETETETRTTYSDSFEELWSLARKGSKKTAYAQYRKAVPKKIDHAALLDARRKHVQGREPQYHKSLDLWIRDERWDEVSPNGSGPKARPTVPFGGTGRIEV